MCDHSLPVDVVIFVAFLLIDIVDCRRVATQKQEPVIQRICYRGQKILHGYADCNYCGYIDWGQYFIQCSGANVSLITG
jgi:hypothetical protein